MGKKKLRYIYIYSFRAENGNYYEISLTWPCDLVRALTVGVNNANASAHITTVDELLIFLRDINRVFHNVCKVF